MDKIVKAATRVVNEADLRGARMGTRFGRLDLMSQLAVLAVEPMKGLFAGTSPDRIGMVLSARAGSLSTDAEYWDGRDRVGGPSPTLFAYTLPSAAMGEVAIRHGLRGPNLCFVGDGDEVVSEAEDMIRRGEADGCVCLICDVVTPNAASVIEEGSGAEVRAMYLKRGS